MKQPVLFGTSSRAKLDHVRSLVRALPVRVLSPAELGLNLHVEENGNTPEANAQLKAAAYGRAAALPAFAIDAGLTIDRFAPGAQPGVFVRRVNGNEHQSDHQLIEHYVEQLRRVGGESPGRWQVGIALAMPGGATHLCAYAIESRFTASVSQVVIPDAPLSSLMLDPISGTYYSEMAYGERPDSVQLRKTLLTLFQHLPAASK